MTTTTPARRARGPVLLAADDVASATEAARLLHDTIDDASTEPVTVLLLTDAAGDRRAVLPHGATGLLADLLTELASGSAVSIVPLQAELTTQQAADLLGVSRPYLVGLLEQGEIAHRRVGNRRRVPVADLLRYKDEQDARSRAAVAALTEQAEELGMYDD